MRNPEQSIYIIDSTELEMILREIIRSELRGLEESIKKEPKILSRTEASKFLGYCPNTISEFVKKGIIPNRGKGRKISILESDLLNIRKKRNF